MMRGLSVWIVVFAAACGSDVSAPEQVGEACGDLGDAICERAVDCGFVSSNDQLSCVNAFFAACCADDGVCTQPVTANITDAEWSGCLDAVDTQSCADLDSGNLPSECLGL